MATIQTVAAAATATATTTTQMVTATTPAIQVKIPRITQITNLPKANINVHFYIISFQLAKINFKE